MRNPEDRSPQEWRDHFRHDEKGVVYYTTTELTADDCDELAQRMDDLAEALRLLRDMMVYDDTIVNAPDADWHLLNERDALLAKYEEVDSE